MNSIFKVISLIALVAAILPSVLFFSGVIGHDAMKWIALVGTIAWFIATPLWMGRTPLPHDTEVEI